MLFGDAVLPVAGAAVEAAPVGCPPPVPFGLPVVGVPDALGATGPASGMPPPSRFKKSSSWSAVASSAEPSNSSTWRCRASCSAIDFSSSASRLSSLVAASARLACIDSTNNCVQRRISCVSVAWRPDRFLWFAAICVKTSRSGDIAAWICSLGIVGEALPAAGLSLPVAARRLFSRRWLRISLVSSSRPWISMMRGSHDAASTTSVSEARHHLP